MQTEKVISLSAATAFNHSVTAGRESGTLPPGITTRSGGGQSSKVYSGTTRRKPMLVRGPRDSATV